MQTSDLADDRFDADWYLARYPDVARSGLDPHDHWLAVGRRLGREGSASTVAAQAPRLACPHVPDDLRTEVHRSGVFDESWYRSRYAPVFDDDLLADFFHAWGEGQVRDPGPLFSSRYYLERNPDIGGINPFVHFVKYGVAEGRYAFCPNKVGDFFGENHFDVLTPLREMIDPAKPVVVLHWAEGNFFFTEIAEYMPVLLDRLGYRADVRTDDAGIDPETINLLVVAPHEYGIHGPGRDWDDARAAGAIYFNTEQWHTSWFTLAWRVARRSGKVLDLNPASAAALARLGFTSGFVPLLPLAGSCFDHPRAALSPAVSRAKVVKPLTYPQAIGDRPYDAMFVGAHNQRRGEMLAMLAPALAPFDNFIHMPGFLGPVKPGDPDMLSSREFAQIARNTKVLINIHQGESRYFEWHRMVLSGMMEGCVVVTEPSDHVELLVPGTHYIEATVSEMVTLLPQLLGTAAGHRRLAEIHANCRALRARIEAGDLLLLP